MNREDLKQWLKVWLDGNSWGYGSTQRLKHKHKDKYNLIIESTHYLQIKCKLSERIFHIVHDLHEVKKCPDCKEKWLLFRTLSEGYKCRCKVCNDTYRKEYVDPKTGLTMSQMIAKKAANTMLNTIDSNGKNTYSKSREKTVKIMKTNIDGNGKNGYDRVQEKATKTKRNTIDENGKSIYDRIGNRMSEWCNEIDRETGLSNAQKRGLVCVESKNNIIDPKTGFNMHKIGGQRAQQTKIKNRTALSGTSIQCTNMVKDIIDYLNLDQNNQYELYYGDKADTTKKEWYSSIANTAITYALYDFTIRNKQNKKPIMVIEYHGSAFHINKETYEQLILKDIDKFDPYGNSLRRSYERDQIKKQHMINKYNCKYIEVFDYMWKNNKQAVLTSIVGALNYRKESNDKCDRNNKNIE